MDVVEFRGYRVLAPLGQGGFGKTYLVEDTQSSTRQQYVIKQFCPTVTDAASRQVAQERFQREAAVLLDLGQHHAQIPKLFSYFSQEDGFYLVLEYIEGLTLTQKFRQSGPLSETFVTQVLDQVLQILEYVHNRRIIHRDVKPDNIIIRHGDNQPVLIDFGAVKESVQSQGAMAGGSSPSIVIGSPGFMPAEQAAGRPTYASDLYSLGMTAIYLLTGKMPQDFPIDPRRNEVNWELELSRFKPQLVRVLARAVRFNPAERYATARDMRLALSGTASGEAAAGSVRPTELAESGWERASQPVEHEGRDAGAGAGQQPLTHPTQVVSPRAGDAESGYSGNLYSGSRQNLGDKGFAPNVNQAAEIPARGRGARRWLIALGGAAAVFALGLGGIYLYSQQQAESLMQTAMSLKDQGRFQGCLSQLSSLVGLSESAAARELKGECQLGLAKEMAKQGSLAQALEQVVQIPDDVTVAAEARRLDGEWVKRLLNLARPQYEQGDLKGALAVVESVPKNSRHRSEADTAVKQWQTEWQQNEENLKTAQKAVDNGNWQLAQTLAGRLTTTYWQAKGEPILQKAAQLQADANPDSTPLPNSGSDDNTGNDDNSGQSGGGVNSSDFNPGTAAALVEDLYVKVSSKDYAAARALYAPGVANQFDPAFFDQFRQVTVENLTTTNTSDTEIRLTGENVYTWPDASTQRELRSYTVERIDGKALLRESKFIKVLKIRS
jgi:hypothetical protein